MNIAVYPGRFDPVTNGHLDIVRRASVLFDKVIVAIYNLDHRTTLFSTNQRVDFFKTAVADLANVEVESFTGLVVEFAQKRSAHAIVRGIRALTDFEAEFSMSLMNARMAPQVESVYLMTRAEYMFISASRIREVSSLGYDVAGLVPDHVANILRQKFPKVVS